MTEKKKQTERSNRLTRNFEDPADVITEKIEAFA